MKSRRLTAILILTVVLAALLFPKNTYALPVVCNPCARAVFDVTDFTQDALTWLLKVVVDGNAENSTFLSEKVGDRIYLNLYKYNGIYDSGTNTTTFSDSYRSLFTRVYGSFPADTWYFQYFFAINASVQNIVHSSSYPFPDTQVLVFPSQNYVGNYTILPVYPTNSTPNPFEEVAQLQQGAVYNLTSYIWRNNVYTQVLGVIFTGTLYVLVGGLYAVPFVQLYLQRPTRRLFRNFDGNLLNGTYFGAVVGVLFFLPIYVISFRPSLAPVAFTDLDWAIWLLTEITATLLIFSYFVHLGLRLRNSSEDEGLRKPRKDKGRVRNSQNGQSSGTMKPSVEK